jgi:hypothetical protein
VTLTTSNVTYETGPLGRFYLPANSALTNKASQSATNVGLYHFTCTTNQVKETNSTADIGFHYIALSTTNTVADTDAEGLPDYVEDADGDGIVDTAESSWLSPGYTNGLSDLQVWELSSNVQVNDPVQDTGSNTNTQFETTMVAFGNTVICAWVDSNLGVTGYGTSENNCGPDENDSWSPPAGSIPRFIGWAVSKDGGVSFADKGSPPVFIYVADGMTNTLGDAGDPLLARDTNLGTIYLLGNPKRPSYYYPDGTNNSAKMYLPLWRSTDGGESFLSPSNTLPGMQAGLVDPISGDIADKPALAVDNYPGTGNGSLYAAIRCDSNQTRRIVFNRSAAGGATWYSTNLLVLSEPGGHRPALTVRSNHEVCILFLDGAKNVLFRKSMDLGANFSVPTNIVSLNQAGFTLRRYSNAAPDDAFNAAVVPALAANPVNNDLYVVYHDEPSLGAGKPNIYFVQSTNAGTNWDARLQVNLETTNSIPTDQWQPAITIKPDGTKLFIAWYDRRNDTASNLLIQIYGCFANIPITTNSFTNNFLISTAQFPPIHSGTNTNANTFDPVYPPPFDLEDPRHCGSFRGIYRVHMGDYDTAVSDSRFVYYSWMDGRNTCTNSGVVRNQADIRHIRVSWPP